MTESSTSNELIKDHDPNIRWGKKKIEVIVQQWDFRKTFITEVGGNCVGFTNLECATGNIFDNLPTKPMLGDNGMEDVPYIIMENDKGDDCEFMPEDENPYRWDDWFKNMVVSVKLLEVTPEKP